MKSFYCILILSGSSSRLDVTEKLGKIFLNLSVDSAFLFKGTGTKSKKIVWWKVFKVSLITIQNNPYHNLKFMNIKQSSSKVT